MLFNCCWSPKVEFEDEGLDASEHGPVGDATFRAAFWAEDTGAQGWVWYLSANW